MRPWLQAVLWCLAALAVAALLLRIGWIDSGLLFGLVAVELVIVAHELRRAG